MNQPPVKRKLSRQLLSGFGASLGVLGLATGCITYLSWRHNLEDQVQQRAETITHGLEFASEGSIEIQDMVLLERIIQNYATLPTVMEVSIVDPQGMVLAHSDLFELNQRQSRRYADLHPTMAPLFQQVSEQGLERNFRIDLNGKPVVVHMLPFSGTLFNRGQATALQRRGVAIAVLDLQQLEQEAWVNTLSAIFAVMVSAGLILVFMGWLIRRLVLMPLKQMDQAIRQSEQLGSFTLPNLPNNEMGFLGSTFAGVFEQLRAYKQLELEIAERKYAEVAQRYELATRAAKVWVWDWHIETDALVLDQEIGDWLGFINLELPKQLTQWIQNIPASDRHFFLESLQAHVDGKTPEFSCEHRLLDASGVPRWFLSRGQVVQDDCSGGRRAIGTITDIAERKQAESQLQRSNEELARATRLKDEFLANMSHELRTPLNAILGMTEGLQEQVFGPVTQRQLTALQTIERGGSHLLELINDILDVAKIESGQIELECISTAIAPLCQSSLTFIKQQALKKQLQVEVKIPSGIPNLWVDERRMRQVLINLLNNAVKFTPDHGHITLEVSLLPLEEPGTQRFARIAVMDTGIGIAADHISKLFQPFIQIDGALNRQYSGTGLGLALVKQIVELHGGRVGVTSQPGLGSCFTIDLPCGGMTTSEGRPSPTAAQPSSVPVMDLPVSPLILLVEDNDANVTTVSSYLKAKGYRMLLARNGQDAIAVAQAEHPDLILMDIQMPGMDGFEAIQQIHGDADLERIPIIALTALAMDGDRDRCLAAGANDYISKPIKLKQLVTTIQHHLAAPPTA